MRCNSRNGVLVTTEALIWNPPEEVASVLGRSLMSVGAGAGSRTLRSRSLKHMVATHKTTLLSSNCPGIDVTPAGDPGSVECHRAPLASLLLPHLWVRSAAAAASLCDLDTLEWRKCTEQNQLLSGFPKAHTYLIIFQEVVLFWGGRGSCTSAVAELGESRAMAALQWNSEDCPVQASAGHHDPRYTEPELCYSDSVPGFNCSSVGVRQPDLHTCWGWVMKEGERGFVVILWWCVKDPCVKVGDRWQLGMTMVKMVKMKCAKTQNQNNNYK